MFFNLPRKFVLETLCISLIFHDMLGELCKLIKEIASKHSIFHQVLLPRRHVSAHWRRNYYSSNLFTTPSTNLNGMKLKLDDSDGMYCELELLSKNFTWTQRKSVIDDVGECIR